MKVYALTRYRTTRSASDVAQSGFDAWTGDLEVGRFIDGHGSDDASEGVDDYLNLVWWRHAS